MQTPCWDIADVDVCQDCCTDALDGLDEFRRDTIYQWAAWFLWRATGKVYGLCEQTFRPCRRECDGTSGLPRPQRIDGQWYNLSCGSCSGTCGCDQISEVYLPGTWSITSVMIDGVDYPDPVDMVAVYDRSRLVRIDGGTWPSCQNLSQIDGPGVWSVTAQMGLPIPPGGKVAAGILACELARACVGDSECRLPKRVQTITRQGVTAAFQDQFESLPELRTGLWEVDSFIEMARSSSFGSPSVISPDIARPAELTWPVLS